MKKEYLNEEKYQKTKKKISIAALIVLVIGLLLGISLIYLGFVNMNKINSEFSEENHQNKILTLEKQVEEQEKNLETKKEELKAKGIEYSSFVSYEDGEKYDLYIITNALNPRFSKCDSDEYKENKLTKKYCFLKNELETLERMDLEFERGMNSDKYIPLFMLGGFIIFSSSMIAFSIYRVAKRREIAAFSAQQIMPVAEEGIEKMAPAIGKVGGEIAKNMAPAYGEIAKEISKGIKEGLKDEK